MSVAAKSVSGVVAVAALAITSNAFATDYLCTPTEVGVYTSRLHIQCSQPATDGTSSIRFFAVPTSDAVWANRFLTVMSSAVVAGRQVTVTFTPGDTSGASF